MFGYKYFPLLHDKHLSFVIATQVLQSPLLVQSFLQVLFISSSKYPVGHDGSQVFLTKGSGYKYFPVLQERH